MQVSNVQWSDTEKQVAQAAFATAYQREISALLQEVRSKALTLKTLEELWQLHDFLSARRHDIDGKYDYQDSALIFLFAQLVKEGWLQLEELKGLATDKLTKVTVLTRM